MNIDIILEHSARIDNASASAPACARARTLASFASKLHCPIFRADFAVTSRRIIVDWRLHMQRGLARRGAIKMILVFSQLSPVDNKRRAARPAKRDAHVMAVLPFIDKSIAPPR